MNVVDTSAWIEYLNDGPNARLFAPVIEDLGDVVVPTLVVYEVFKRIARTAGDDAALAATGLMLQGTIAELTTTIAIEAARLSLVTKLAMADATVLATARVYDATLWTQDADFAGIEGVRYVPKA